jgi:hypothetical protein
MPELHGKGWRVLGYFVWMLGAGLVLESDAVALGVLLLLAGGTAFVIGALQERQRRAETGR